jgi:signal transduction histidine kinase
MWKFSTNETRELRQAHSQLESLVLQRTSELQTLSQRLLRVQDEERRRVARDLHDSTGQTLTALKIAVALLQRKLDANPEIDDDISAIESLADQALQEIRTTSYLLHPPLLDEVGFGCAADLYLEGFGKRSGIKVRMDFAQDSGRMPNTIEIALFRVLQESLTNVHRHSGASEVDIVFRRETEMAILEVRDYGCGIPEELLGWGLASRGSGVGLPGMRERLRELNGSLEIEAAHPGTRVRATVPLLSNHHPVIVDIGVATLRASQPVVAQQSFQAAKSAHSSIFNLHRAMGSILDREMD